MYTRSLPDPSFWVCFEVVSVDSVEVISDAVASFDVSSVGVGCRACCPSLALASASASASSFFFCRAANNALPRPRPRPLDMFSVVKKLQ